MVLNEKNDRGKCLGLLHSGYSPDLSGKVSEWPQAFCEKRITLKLIVSLHVCYGAISQNSTALNFV